MAELTKEQIAEKAAAIEIPVAAEPKGPAFEWKKGPHLVKLVMIEQAFNQDGSRKTDKNGTPGIRITFAAKKQKMIVDGQEVMQNPLIDNLYWPGGKAQFILDKVVKACGLDNTKATFSGDKMLDKSLYIVIKHVKTKESPHSDFTKDSEGNPFIRYEIFDYAQHKDSTGKELELPAYSDDQLEGVNIYKAPEAKPAAASSGQGSEAKQGW